MKSDLLFSRTLGQALASPAIDRRSGIVRLVSGRLVRLFCLVDGRLGWVASNLVEEQLGAMLVRRRLIDSRTLEAASTWCAKHQCKLSGVLLEQELLSRLALESAIGALARQILAASLELKFGEVSFEAGRPNAAGEVTVSLPIPVLIFDYAAEHPKGLSQLRTQIGAATMRPLVRQDRLSLVDDSLRTTVVDYLIQRCDGTPQLAEIAGKSPVAAEPTLRAVYALILLGVIQPYVETRRESKRVLDAMAEPVSADEILARIRRAEEADYYAILELQMTATRDEVRNAYYFLARRYHPDRFREGTLKNLLGAIETYFAQVTEAYNTLYEPELRAAYDTKRGGTEETQRAEPEQDTASLARQNYARAKILLGRGRHADAVTFLENAVELDGLQSLYHETLGEVLVRNPRRRVDAEQHLRRAIELEPTNAAAQVALADLYCKTQRKPEAVAALREALRWDPDNVAAAGLLGELEAETRGSSGSFKGLFGG